MDKFDSIDDRLRDKCEVSRVIQVENRIRVLEDRFAAYDQGLNHKIMTLEAGVALHEDRLERIRELEELEEDKDVESRKANIILYRVAEDKTEDLTTRNNKDEAFVIDLLDRVFDTKCYQGDIAKLYRLGRWSLDGSVARPLLVGFSQIDMKSKVMSNLRQGS